MIATIRNCPSTTRGTCPWTWDRLAPGENPSARLCSGCDRPVFYCVTDAETVAHARAGQVVARETPTEVELGTEYDDRGRPMPWRVDITPEQQEAHRRRFLEMAIDDSIRRVRYSSRDCPVCHFPVPDYRKTCHICWLEVGRVLDEDGMS
jgi:hypothetical protein